jgi:hypothetical protein
MDLYATPSRYHNLGLALSDWELNLHFNSILLGKRRGQIRKLTARLFTGCMQLTGSDQDRTAK